MSRDMAQSRGMEPLARVVSTAMVGCDPAIMGMGPLPAIRSALEKVHFGTARLSRLTPSSQPLAPLFRE